MADRELPYDVPQVPKEAGIVDGTDGGIVEGCRR